MDVHYIILDEDVYSAKYLSELMESVRPMYCLDGVLDDCDEAANFLTGNHVDLVFCDREFLYGSQPEDFHQYLKKHQVIFTDSQKRTGDERLLGPVILKPFSMNELSLAIEDYESLAAGRQKMFPF